MENNQEKENKIDYLISNWFKELEINNQIFNTIDQKIMWFFTFISAIQWYLLANKFIEKSIDISKSKDLILILILVIWFTILWFNVYILKWKRFLTWPNTLSQTNEFKEDSKSLLNLKSNTLWALNQSNRENDIVIKNKSKYFRYSMNLLVTYFLFITVYFLI